MEGRAEKAAGEGKDWMGKKKMGCGFCLTEAVQGKRILKAALPRVLQVATV